MALCATVCGLLLNTLLPLPSKKQSQIYASTNKQTFANTDIHNQTILKVRAEEAHYTLSVRFHIKFHAVGEQAIVCMSVSAVTQWNLGRSVKS